jgi:uncharacterized protein YecT (DUF1311 family)
MIPRLHICVAACAMIFASSGAAKAEAPAAKDLAAVQTCLQKKGVHPSDREACIGVVATPCIGDEGAHAPSETIACFEREQSVWGQLLDGAFGKLQKSLDDDQRNKLQEMQRSWLDTRERTCAFYYHYFQGSMANPMMANCNNRETARRALFLLGFSEDLRSDNKR